MKERWLVTGATGLVGPALCAHASALNADVVRTSRRGGALSIPTDLATRGEITALLNAVSPDRVIHLGAMARPAEADKEPRLAAEINVESSIEIARWCAKNHRPLIFASTDYVFDGEAGPYRENDEANPATVYGRMKRDAEIAVLELGGLVARLGWVLNDTGMGRSDFIQTSLARLSRGEAVQAVDDEHRTPIMLSVAAEALCRVAMRGETGILHFAGSDHVTPFRLLSDAARRAGLPQRLVRRSTRQNLSPRGRPRDLRLDASRLGAIMSEGGVGALALG